MQFLCVLSILVIAQQSNLAQNGPSPSATPSLTPQTSSINQETPTPSSTPQTPVAQQEPSPIPKNRAPEAARFLAGLPVSPESPLSSWTQDPRWISFSDSMNSAFVKLEQTQLSHIRTWRAQFLDPLTQQNQTCLYLFSGPDFLYADAFFPNCTTYVLQGLEPVNLIPDLSNLPKDTLFATLQSIQSSLHSELRWSFFITKNMREDFQHTALKGVLPIIYVFLARSGKEMNDVSAVSLSNDGTLKDDSTGKIKGVRIHFTDTTTGVAKTLYYFTGNLSDDHINSDPALVNFCSKLGATNSFLKAASYLMFEKNFKTVRNLILKSSSVLLEDDSGIPIQFFPRKNWTMRFFGAYTKPVDLFKQYYQPALQQVFTASAPLPLTFAFGYQWNPPASGIILATHR
jgi:hypothetical protein